MKQYEECYKGFYQKSARNVNRRVSGLLLLLILSVQIFAGVNNKSENDMTTLTKRIMLNDDEAAIRALENGFASAFNAGDIDAIMKNYISDESLVVFDVVPRKQYMGAKAYREDWMDFFSHFNGKPKITINDLGITVDGNIGFSHSIQHVTGTDKQGHPVDRTVRVTDGYRKIGGKWLIVMEHVSVPVDLKTGKAAATPKN